MSPGVGGWYSGRSVFITGHTGFKGSWLTEWLRSCGAVVTGFSLAAPSQPTLFEAAGLARGIDSVTGDVRDHEALRSALVRSQPEIVFHLAAQSLVRRSYEDPVSTFATNVMGTVHLLDLVRSIPSVRAAVVVTSDKCYENLEIDHAYREDARMGGHDPYSASKGCAELVTSAMYRSFLRDTDLAVASARAGNVFGGGDWAADRLVPDMMRAAALDQATPIRNPSAVRPWQHVLEPLRGYLMLGRALVERGDEVCGGWNFGPPVSDCVAVLDIAERMHDSWGSVRVEPTRDDRAPHEAGLLKLDCSKARDTLGWEPLLGLNRALDLTVQWYRAFYDDPSRARHLVEEQLTEYQRIIAGSTETHGEPQT